MITVEGHNRTSGVTSVGSLTLCDLAGSERVGKTEAKGKRLVEAAAINKSLSALGQVGSTVMMINYYKPQINSCIFIFSIGSIFNEYNYQLPESICIVGLHVEYTQCNQCVIIQTFFNDTSKYPER